MYVLGVRATCIRVGLATDQSYKPNSRIIRNNTPNSLATFPIRKPTKPELNPRFRLPHTPQLRSSKQTAVCTAVSYRLSVGKSGMSRTLEQWVVMSHSFDGLTESPASVEQIHAAFGREDYWQARVAAASATATTLDSLTVDADGTVTVRVTQHLGPQLLPGPIA